MVTEKVKLKSSFTPSDVAIRRNGNLGQYTYIEKGAGDDKTDPSGYIPISKQVEAFLRGSPLVGTPQVQYESTATGEEEKLFEMADTTEAMLSDLNNVGESGLKAKLHEVRLEIAKLVDEEAKKKKAQSAPRPEVPAEGAGKPVQGAPAQA